MNSKILPSSGISQQSTPPTIARQKTMHDFFRDSNIPNDANGLSKSFQHNFKHVFWYKFDEGFANPLCQVAGLVTIIFLVGIIITFTFILFKIFSKEEIEEENELDYYSRHNFPINEKKDVPRKNS